MTEILFILYGKILDITQKDGKESAKSLDGLQLSFLKN